MVTVLTGDQNDIGINGLNIYVIKTRSIVKMSSLGVIGSNLRCKRATKKGSIVDNNDLRTTGLEMSGLEIIGLSLHYEKITEKRSTVDNNGVGTISLKISGLGEISSSLLYDGHSQYC